MNERIQELHEQAMKSCDEHRSDILNYHRIYREKFAELIIRECAGVAEISMPPNSHSDERLKVKNSVLEHFGVEE